MATCPIATVQWHLPRNNKPATCPVTPVWWHLSGNKIPRDTCPVTAVRRHLSGNNCPKTLVRQKLSGDTCPTSSKHSSSCLSNETLSHQELTRLSDRPRTAYILTTRCLWSGSPVLEYADMAGLRERLLRLMHGPYSLLCWWTLSNDYLSIDLSIIWWWIFYYFFF